LYASGYFGKDRFYNTLKSEYYTGSYTSKDESDAEIRWGNAIAALRWNYLITPRLFSNTTITYSRYNFSVYSKYKEERIENGSVVSFDEFEANYFSGIEDFSMKVDFNWMPKNDHRVIFGGGAIAHTFTPGTQNFSAGSSSNLEQLDTVLGSSKINAYEWWTYAEDQISLGSRLTVNLGVHLTGFLVQNSHYTSLQPRISAHYLLSKKWALKASYTEMQQFLHLLSNTSIGLPTDLWVPPTDAIPPQFARQFALGIGYDINPTYQLTLEGYYKKMDQLIEYKDGASFFTLGTDWQDLVEYGQGWSYGLEVFFEKRIGKSTGWIGYTLSWSNRQFENISFGEVFPYRYDRRHDISIAYSHAFSDRIDIGIVWVYGTGNAVTLGLERYLSLDGAFNQWEGGFGYQDIDFIEGRNNYRMASYHRLDVGVNFRKKKKWGERTWNVGFYNIYNRNNPFYLYFDTNVFGQTNLYQIGLFPIVPSVSYHFKF
jgi:hypothetical protein